MHKEKKTMPVKQKNQKQRINKKSDKSLKSKQKYDKNGMPLPMGE